MITFRCPCFRVRFSKLTLRLGAALSGDRAMWSASSPIRCSGVSALQLYPSSLSETHTECAKSASWKPNFSPGRSDASVRNWPRPMRNVTGTHSMFTNTSGGESRMR